MYIFSCRPEESVYLVFPNQLNLVDLSKFMNKKYNEKYAIIRLKKQIISQKP